MDTLDSKEPTTTNQLAIIRNLRTISNPEYMRVLRSESFGGNAEHWTWLEKDYKNIPCGAVKIYYNWETGVITSFGYNPDEEKEDLLEKGILRTAFFIYPAHGFFLAHKKPDLGYQIIRIVAMPKEGEIFKPGQAEDILLQTAKEHNLRVAKEAGSKVVIDPHAKIGNYDKDNFAIII